MKEKIKLVTPACTRPRQVIFIVLEILTEAAVTSQRFKVIL